MAKTSEVDGDNVPCRHFGVVLSMKQWHELAERLQAARTAFIIEPHIRFKRDPSEQATLFFIDPSCNASNSRRLSLLRICFLSRERAAPMLMAFLRKAFTNASGERFLRDIDFVKKRL